MTRWTLFTRDWRGDGLTLTGVDSYGSKASCDMMGHIATAWFGVDWVCVIQVFV